MTLFRACDCYQYPCEHNPQEMDGYYVWLDYSENEHREPIYINIKPWYPAWLVGLLVKISLFKDKLKWN